MIGRARLVGVLCFVGYSVIFSFGELVELGLRLEVFFCGFRVVFLFLRDFGSCFIVIGF